MTIDADLQGAAPAALPGVLAGVGIVLSVLMVTAWRLSPLLSYIYGSFPGSAPIGWYLPTHPLAPEFSKRASYGPREAGIARNLALSGVLAAARGGGRRMPGLRGLGRAGGGISQNGNLEICRHRLIVAWIPKVVVR